MSDAYFFRSWWRGLCLALLPLLLAACAGTSRTAYYPPAPASNFTVRVRAGDSLSEIAYRYQVKEEDLLALNTIYDRNALNAGQMMRVPAYGHLREPAGRQGGRPAQPVRGGGNPRLGRAGAISRAPLPPPGDVRNVSYVPVPQTRPGPSSPPFPQRRPPVASQFSPEPSQQTSFLGWLNPSDSRGVVQTGSSAQSRFLWPVSGPVIASFGQYPGGGRNDGINIQAQRGTPVHAAAAGTVTYVGNELKGYGNLILIRHDNGYVTAYAHSDSVAVERGARVTRGQIIGYAGMTGDVDRPQVHFELRVGTRPVDPKPYLTS